MRLFNQKMAQERSEQAYDRAPSSEDWGFLGFDEGSGTGGMYWFESKQELLNFLRDSHLSNYFDLENLDSQEKHLLQQIDNLMGKFSDPSPEDLVELMREYNEYVKGIMDLTWIGQFKEILFSESEFAKEVRSSVRISIGREDTDGPVVPEELDMFTTGIHSYGI